MFTRDWRVGRRIRCREVEASGDPTSETGALDLLMRAAKSEFGRSLPLMESELQSDGVPDLDALETLASDVLLGCGATGYATQPEALDGYFC